MLNRLVRRPIDCLVMRIKAGMTAPQLRVMSPGGVEEVYSACTLISSQLLVARQLISHKGREVARALGAPLMRQK